MRRRGLVMAVATSLACLWGPPAGAHAYDGATAGVWSYNEEFEGRVWSDEDPCVRRRLVKLQELDEDEWVTVGKARSDEDGYWSIEFDDPDGEFRHVVRPRSKVTDQHFHECRRFASGIMPF